MSKPEMTEAEIINAFKKAGFFVNDKGVITVGPNDTLTACELTNVFNIAMSQRVRTGEAVLWQYRTKAAWDKKGPWQPWRDCSKEQYEDVKKTPLLHDWEYESRELFTTPPSPPSSRELMEKIKAVFKTHKDTAIAYGFTGDADMFSIIEDEVCALIPQEPSKEEGNG
jgi:hypothetical protein